MEAEGTDWAAAEALAEALEAEEGEAAAAVEGEVGEADAGDDEGCGVGTDAGAAGGTEEAVTGGRTVDGALSCEEEVKAEDEEKVESGEPDDARFGAADGAEEKQRTSISAVTAGDSGGDAERAGLRDRK